MPLVRYEVRCEHSLANPELYRSAARDDPESLLEGVAMAGLVGIVRQLGDLAEFAAEIFCSLHDELMTIGSRGHDLNMRVQQLEDELPVVEKALLSEPNQLRFAYTNGADWHASIRSDQNHCTSGDLPRFVRNYYEECRGPPQLFLLDKFDVSGVGACLKRYTDPSFFKLEWASTELMRAQREQRGKRARRDKKKGRKRRTGEPIAAINQIPARVRYGSASLEDLEGLPHDVASALKVDVPVPSRPGGTLTPRGLPRGPKDMLLQDPNSPALKPIQVSAVSNTSEGVKHSEISDKETGSANDSGNVLNPCEPEGTASSVAGGVSRKGYTRGPDSEGLESANGFGDAGMDNGHLQSVDSKATNGISRDDSGAAAMPRSVRTPVGTPRVTAKGESSMDVTEGEKLSPMLLQCSSRRSVYMDALDTGRLSGKFSWRNSGDGNESYPGRFSRQVSMARSGSEYEEFVDAPSRIVSEGESDFESPGSGHKATHFNRDALNHAALKNHVEGEEAEIPKLMEQQQPIPTSGELADTSEVVLKENLQLTDNRALLQNPSPIPSVLNEDHPASSASSGQSDTPVGHVRAPIQQSGVVPNSADNRSGELLKAFPSNGNDDSHIQVVPVKDIHKIAEVFNSRPTPSSLGSSSSAPSPTHAGQEVLQPSISMFSRHSYSSELISVSSDSAPNSPTSQNSPTSPAFHALYSPRGENSRPLNSIPKSPTAYLGSSYSPERKKSNQSSPSLEEVPVLSQSPTSLSRPSHLDLSLEEDSQPHLPSQLYPLPTPPSKNPDPDSPSKSGEFSYSITGGFGGPASPPENGHTEAFYEDNVHPHLQLSPTSKSGNTTQLEVQPATLDEPVPPPVMSSKAGVIPSSPKSDTPRCGSSAPSSPPGSPKKSSQRIFLSSPSVLVSPSVRHISDDGNQCRSLGDEDNTTLSSPSGSVIIKDSPPESPRSSYTGSECESRDFDAIQGRPATSGSAGFFRDHAMEKSRVSKREADVDEEVASIVSVRSKPSETAARTSSDKVQSLLLSPTSHSSSKHSEMAVVISSNFSLDSIVSDGSADHLVSQERVSPSRNPSIRPQVDPLPATLKHISTVRLTTKSHNSLTSNSPPDPPGREEQAGNNIQWRGKAVPPRTPPRAAFNLPHHPPLWSPLRSPLHTPRSFWSETGTLKWLGRLDPGFSPKPDFSLPPNLVCHSETSSPVCSPPQLDLDSPTKSTMGLQPSEDLDSPHTTSIHLHGGGEEEENRPPASTSFVNADDFSSLGGHDSEEDYGDENVGQVEPQRVELSATSNSGPSHSSSSSLEGVPSSEAVDPQEVFHVLTRVAEIEHLSVSTGGAVSNQSSPRAIEQSRVSLPREAESSQELEVLSSADAKVRSTDSQQASPSLLEEPESTSEYEHMSDARVQRVAAQRDLDLSLTPRDMSESIHERLDEADSSVAAHAIENASPSPSRKEDRSVDSKPVNEAGIVAAHATEKASRSPLEKAERSLDADRVKEADVGAAHGNEKASPFPFEKEEISLHSEPVNATDHVGATGRSQKQLPLSPSQETIASPNSAPSESSIAAQFNEEVLPSLSTPEADNSGESTALHGTEVPAKAHSMEHAVTPVSESELRTTPTTKAALEAAIARHDRNMLKELTFQAPVLRPRPSTDERSLFIDQIRTASFNLRRTESLEKKELPVPRPVVNINVAAILEKANAIRQAFAGSDDDDDDGDDDWSDS